MWVVAANGIALSVRARASELKMRSAPRMIKMMPCLIGNGLCSFIIPAIAMAMRNEKRYVFGVSDVGIYPAVGANRQRGGVLAMRQKHVADYIGVRERLLVGDGGALFFWLFRNAVCKREKRRGGKWKHCE